MERGFKDCRMEYNKIENLREAIETRTSTEEKTPVTYSPGESSTLFWMLIFFMVFRSKEYKLW